MTCSVLLFSVLVVISIPTDRDKILSQQHIYLKKRKPKKGDEVESTCIKKIHAHEDVNKTTRHNSCRKSETIEII